MAKATRTDYRFIRTKKKNVCTTRSRKENRAEEDSPLTPCRICGKVGDEELMLIGRTWRRHPSCAPGSRKWRRYYAQFRHRANATERSVAGDLLLTTEEGQHEEVSVSASGRRSAAKSANHAQRKVADGQRSQRDHQRRGTRDLHAKGVREDVARKSHPFLRKDRAVGTVKETARVHRTRSQSSSSSRTPAKPTRTRTTYGGPKMSSDECPFCHVGELNVRGPVRSAIRSWANGLTRRSSNRTCLDIAGEDDLE